MATLVPAQYFGFKQRGAVAPGYAADLIVVSDFESFTVEQVYKNGTLVAEHGKTLKPAPLDIDRVRFSHVMDSFDLDEITLRDMELRESGEQERVICLNRGELLTEEKIIPFQRHQTITGQIRALEERLQGKLFKRKGRGLEPSELGELVYRYADKMCIRDRVSGLPFFYF